MTDAFTTFTPWASLTGGLLIGASATLLMLFLGRILGASGLIASLLRPGAPGEFGWRLALLAGMVSGPILYSLATGRQAEITVPVSLPMLIIGGVIVGVGVTFGSGCTSGHGICGNARVSPRSMVATVTFMVFAGLTVYIIRHVLGG